ncbi:general secretion pathway protein GspK [bacterium]|nr:general secretion pathway protein GspK [bacterium]
MTRRARHSLFSPASRRRGLLLIIVLWVCFGLVSLVIFFGDSMRLEYRAADNAVAEREAAEAVEGAIRYVQYAITNNENPGLMLDTSLCKFDGGQVGDARYWVIGRPNSVASSLPSTKFTVSTQGARLAAAGTVPTFNIVDESSKLNLNGATLEQLELLPGMTPELAGAIIDWRDSDMEAGEYGAEDEVYALLQTPYMCKNARFETVDEIRLLNGATWDILRGEDANFNGVLDENENDGDASYPPDNADGKLDPGLLDYLTVWSKDSSGGGSSTVTRQSIQQALGATLSQERASAIASAASSRLSEIHSMLQLAAIGGMTADELDQVTEAGANIRFSAARDSGGPINVNTAPAAVLQAVMGGDTASADKIVAARQSRAVADQAKLGWVLDCCGAEVIAQYGAAFTAKTNQFSVDIAAVGHNGQGYRRDQFIIDASDATQPRIRYRRDLTRFGWPLGSAVQLANSSTNTGGFTTAGRGQTGS